MTSLTLELKPHGKARLGQRGDFPRHSAPRRTLQYGDTWKRTGIRCTMARSGLTCRNIDNHGFHRRHTPLLSRSSGVEMARCGQGEAMCSADRAEDRA